MGVLRFYSQVLRVALGHALSVAQDILFGAMLFIGLAAFIARQFGPMMDVTPWMQTVTGWQIAALVFGSIVLVRLILAPYWVWREQKERLEDLLKGKADPHTFALEAHAAELRKQNEWHRRAIQSARQLIAQSSRGGNDRTFRSALESSEHYYALRPHLSEDYRRALNTLHGDWHAIVAMESPGRAPPLAMMLANELDRLEKGWGLL